MRDEDLAAIVRILAWFAVGALVGYLIGYQAGYSDRPIAQMLLNAAARAKDEAMNG